MNNIIHNYKRFENESDEELIFRICKDKESIGSWKQVGEILNELTGNEYTESKYRKQFQSFEKMLDANREMFVDDDKQLAAIRLERQEIVKEKRRLFDERLDLNRRLRETSRMEGTIERLENMLTSIGDTRYLPYKTGVKPHDSGNDLIVCLSDWHIGASYYSFCGMYDPDIAKERVAEYLEHVLEIQKTHKAENCTIVLLGDMVSGNIHKTISVTNRENVIEQVKLVCELIADFVYSLGKADIFNKIKIHSVGGNHSRIEAKADALIAERLDNLIPWFLKQMLHNSDNIIVEDEYDDTFCSFSIRDRHYIGVHGDKDAITESSISKLVLWSGFKPDCVIAGHKHHAAMNDVQGIKVIQSGSLGGSGDEYTREKRLLGKPTQTVIVVNEKGVKAIYPLEFNV